MKLEALFQPRAVLSQLAKAIVTQKTVCNCQYRTLSAPDLKSFADLAELYPQNPHN